MSKYVKLLLTSAVALVALLGVVGSAAASESTVSPGGSISSASEGQLTFSGGLFSIRCNVTLNGNLLRGPIRTEGTEVIGSITEVTIARETCSGGRVEGVLALPWNMRQVRILGTAPNSVTGVLFEIVGAKFLLSVFGEAVNCLYEGNPGSLQTYVTTRTAGVYTTGTTTALGTAMRLVSGGELCPATGSMRGTFRTSPVQTITIR